MAVSDIWVDGDGSALDANIESSPMTTESDGQRDWPAGNAGKPGVGVQKQQQPERPDVHPPRRHA